MVMPKIFRSPASLVGYVLKYLCGLDTCFTGVLHGAFFPISGNFDFLDLLSFIEIRLYFNILSRLGVFSNNRLKIAWSQAQRSICSFCCFSGIEADKIIGDGSTKQHEVTSTGDLTEDESSVSDQADDVTETKLKLVTLFRKYGRQFNIALCSKVTLNFFDLPLIFTAKIILILKLLHQSG